MDLKFLVLIRPSDKHAAATGAPEQQRRLRAMQQLKQDNLLELAVEFIGGGEAYIVCVRSTVELAVLLQTNYLFQAPRREVIPVAEATEYLNEMLRQVESYSLAQ